MAFKDIRASLLSDSIEKLTLGAIKPAEFNELLQCIKVSQKLRTLEMSTAGLEDQHIIALADALKTNTSITSLDLSQNAIATGGAMAIAKMLHSNTTLLKLDLYMNNIDDKGMGHILTALKTNSTLTMLNVDANKLTSESIKKIPAIFIGNVTITEFYFSQQAAIYKVEGELAKLVKINNLMINILGESPKYKTTLESLGNTCQRYQMGAEIARLKAETERLNAERQSLQDDRVNESRFRLRPGS